MCRHVSAVCGRAGAWVRAVAALYSCPVWVTLRHVARWLLVQVALRSKVAFLRQLDAERSRALYLRLQAMEEQVQECTPVLALHDLCCCC